MSEKKGLGARGANGVRGGLREDGAHVGLVPELAEVDLYRRQVAGLDRGAQVDRLEEGGDLGQAVALGARGAEIGEVDFGSHGNAV